jgi:hypothetical protein
MPLYFSSHITACLTKQAMRELMAQAFAAREVKVRRAVASQLGGRMLLEIEAPDQGVIERWIEANRLNAEWVMRIDLDGEPGTVQER